MTERPLSCAYPAIVASLDVTPSTASMTIERNVGAFEMLARHDDGELLGHQLGLALATDSGSVDEAIGLAIALHQFINRIARGSRDRRDNGATSSGERIQQRGLADIRTADDRDLGLERRRIFVFLLTVRRCACPSAGSSSGSTTCFDAQATSGMSSYTCSSNSATPLPVSAEIGSKSLMPSRRNSCA